MPSCALKTIPNNFKVGVGDYGSASISSWVLNYTKSFVSDDTLCTTLSTTLSCLAKPADGSNTFSQSVTATVELLQQGNLNLWQGYFKQPTLSTLQITISDQWKFDILDTRLPSVSTLVFTTLTASGDSPVGGYNSPQGFAYVFCTPVQQTGLLDNPITNADDYSVHTPDILSDLFA